MKKLLLVVLTVGLLTSQGIAAQSQRGSIQGVWRTVVVTMTGPAARTVAKHTAGAGHERAKGYKEASHDQNACCRRCADGVRGA